MVAGKDSRIRNLPDKPERNQPKQGKQSELSKFKLYYETNREPDILALLKQRIRGRKWKSNQSKN